MKKYRVSLIAAMVIGGLLAGATLASAQDTKAEGKKGQRGANIEQRLEQMTTQLSLTDEQKPKVKAVLEQTNKKMQELRGTPREERAEKMRPIMEEQNKKLKGILTPEQYTKWEKAAATRKGGGKKRNQ